MDLGRMKANWQRFGGWVDDKVGVMPPPQKLEKPRPVSRTTYDFAGYITTEAALHEPIPEIHPDARQQQIDSLEAKLG